MPAAAGLLSYCRKSTDEIGECAHFRLRARNARRVTGVDATHQPEQVARELAHGLQPFRILRGVLRARTVHIGQYCEETTGMFEIIGYLTS